MILGILMVFKNGITVTVADFEFPHDPRFVLNTFGVICFALVGLELASIMGDEIQEPERTLPGAVLTGGLISGMLYIAVTLTLLVAIGRSGISVLQGIVQAVGKMAGEFGLSWAVPAFAFMLSISIAGIASAWLGGSARIPFVAGLDNYMPHGSAAFIPIRHALRCAHRPCEHIDRALRAVLSPLQRAGSIPDDALPGGRSPVGSISSRLCRASEVGGT